jgi:HK97 family phage major capsid protein
MNIDFGALNSHLKEYNALSNKPRHTKEDERRVSYLQTAISALKSGASLDDVTDAYRRDIAKRYDLNLSIDKRPDAREIEARGWQQLATERRDMDEGSPLNRLGSYTGLGYFVPTGFFPQIFAALAAHDALFDESACTVIKTLNGRPITAPVLGDIENLATVVDEAGTQTSTNISTTGQGVLGAYSYKTPRMVFSIESFQDIDEAIGNINLFKQVTASRLARGIAKHLVIGDGSSKPLGLIPSLEAVGVPSVTASGSAVNTGGSETGANSLGSEDFSAALALLDEGYVSSAKCAWFMNKKTLANISGIVTKYGRLLNLVQYENGKPSIFGIPVKICPSMDNISASAVPVVLGDGTYWATRLVTDENSGIRVYSEATGLVEYGNVGMSCFMRADGELLYTDTNSPAPFTSIRNHS